MTTSPHPQDTTTLTTCLFMSLDGIVEADEQWQFPYFDEELFAGITASWARAGAVLMGRRSFEGYDRLRNTHPESPAVAFLDAVPKYVASTTLTHADWPGTTVLSDDLETQITDLRSRHPGEVLVLGSPTLVRWLLARGLLDVLAVTVLPVLVGAGPRLFDDLELPGPRGVRLIRSHALASGALELEWAAVANGPVEPSVHALDQRDADDLRGA